VNEIIQDEGGLRDKVFGKLQREAKLWIKYWQKQFEYPDSEAERMGEYDPLVEMLILGLENRRNHLFYFNVQKELAKYLYSELRAPDIALNTGNVMVAIKQFSNPTKEPKKVVEIKAEKVNPAPVSTNAGVEKSTTPVQSKSISKTFKLDDNIPPPK
jgi:hypothetical protein